MCFKCSEFFESPSALEHHINTRHSQDITAKQTAALIDMSRRHPESIRSSECPFCDGDWASAEPGVLSAEETVIVVTIDQFRKHLGNHLQQIALFSLPRPTQDEEEGSHCAVAVVDREAGDMPTGRAWLSRGWGLVLGRRATLIAFASFLDLYSSQRHRKFMSQSLMDVGLNDVPSDLKKTGDGYAIIYRSKDSFEGLKIHSRRLAGQNISHPGYITGFTCSSDGMYVASASEIVINIIVASTGKLFRKLQAPSGVGTYYNVAFGTPRTSLLLAGGGQGHRIEVRKYLDCSVCAGT